MPLLWPKAHTTVTYKIVEKFCGLALPIKHASNYIPERYDDMLVFGRTMEEALMSCQSGTYILQFLGFVINLRKLILT